MKEFSVITIIIIIAIIVNNNIINIVINNIIINIILYFYYYYYYHYHHHNYKEILKSDWPSAALISALVGLCKRVQKKSTRHSVCALTCSL